MIPDIKHSRPHIIDEDIQAVCDQLSSGMLAAGQKVEEFEAAVARYIGLRGGIASSSGASALLLALDALEIGTGDEVIIPTYVCSDVMYAVQAVGAKPVLADVGENWCLTAESVLPHMTPRTKAMIVVHVFGIAADIEPIVALGIPVIEDCAQALGGMINERKLGTFGTLCVCSFKATKLLCTGEGGMVLTNDEKLLRKLKPDPGYPMTDMQAALGISQLRRYDELLLRRANLADFYFRELRDLEISLPHHVRDRSIFFRFPIRSRLGFKSNSKAFGEYGIHVRRGVDALLHHALGMDSKHFPLSESHYAETLSLPLYPSLTEEEISYIGKICRDIFKPNA